MQSVIINGKDLKLEEIGLLIRNPKIKINLDAMVLRNVAKSQKFLNQEMNSRILYGINTGFGPMASYILNADQLVELQENLIKSHAVGVGKPIEEKFVLAAMIVRLNTLARGYSGVSVELIKQLQTFINYRIIPIVPEHGAVGTSGDLVQLAHIALALIGEGAVSYKGKTHSAEKILSELGIKPYKLKPKEGLALINGTALMAAIGSLICLDSEHLLNLAIKTGALSLELVRGFTDSISEKLNLLRPHKGQIAVAAMMRELLVSSKLLQVRTEFQKKIKIGKDAREIPESIQEVYSFRCIPQILGPVYDTLAETSKIIKTEINSVTDNPIVDPGQGTFLHGGNFHGDYVASALDQLKITLVKLTMLSERRINFFLNSNINKFLPPFINLKKPGLNLGLQGLQFVATSTTAQSQTLAFPQYVHSIPTNGDNQDIVSMGTEAALLTNKVVENALVVLTVELVTLTQAIDYLKVQKKLSRSSNALYKKVRQHLAKIVDDRVITSDLQKLSEAVKTI